MAIFEAQFGPVKACIGAFTAMEDNAIGQATRNLQPKGNGVGLPRLKVADQIGKAEFIVAAEFYSFAGSTFSL